MGRADTGAGDATYAEAHSSSLRPATRSLVRVTALAYAVLLVGVWICISTLFELRWQRRQTAALSAMAASPATTKLDAGALLSNADLRAVFEAARAFVDGKPVASPKIGAAFHGELALYCQGRPRFRAPIPVATVGADLDGLGSIGHSPSLALLSLAERARCRLKLDVELARGPILTTVEPLFALSLVPGVDGLGVVFGDREVTLSADELVRVRAFGALRPLPGIDVGIGLDTRVAVRLLAQALGVDGDAWSRTPHRLFRYRARSYLEAPLTDEPATGESGEVRRGEPMALFRGVAPGPEPSASELRHGALLGAQFLRDHLHEDGRFAYQYDTLSDEELPPGADYSIPRHAGATYFLAQAGRMLGDVTLVEAAGRALRFLVDNAPPGCAASDRTCVGAPDQTIVDLGSSALALVAAVELERAVGDGTSLPWARKLGAFLVTQQRSDGEFAHLYDLAQGARDEHTHLLYYSGEAAYALARLALLEHELARSRSPHAVAPSETAALVGATDAALHALTVDDYDFFAGGFYYGEDHWTCIAVAEAWDLLPPGPRRDGYADFCEGFARFLARTQFLAGEGPTRDQPDLIGAYGYTPLIPPHTTPVGSRSEALLSIRRVALARGHVRDVADIDAQLRLGLSFLLDHQLRTDGDYLSPNPRAAAGGFMLNDVDRLVRIDSVQHAGSALLRASELSTLFPGPAPAAVRRGR